MAAALGGVDAIVFTAGIGENDAALRAEVAAGCRWLGLELDDALNRQARGRISAAGSRISAWVLPTDEEVGRYYREHQQEFSQNGEIVPFDQARQNVVQAVRTERRRMLVDDWVAGLRRRAEIADLYRSKT